jgi:hypothetical protein
VVLLVEVDLEASTRAHLEAVSGAEEEEVLLAGADHSNVD